MAKQLINIGTKANDGAGDPIRTAFTKVNENFTELYNIVGAGGQYDRLTSGSKTIVLDSDGVLTFPNNETLVSQTGQLYFHKDNNNYVGEIVLQAGSTGLLANHPDIGSGTVIVNPNSITLSIDDNEWGFNNVGTLTTPLLLPKTFTAVLDTAHMVTPVALTDTPWEFVVEFQVNPDGTVQTMIGNNTPFVSNPGYVDGYTFEYTEADHGIPGYTFTLEMYDVIQAGPAGWTTNLAASIPPEYPSTLSSQGAIKLTADQSSLTFGTDGSLKFRSNNELAKFSFDHQLYMNAAVIWENGPGAVINNVPDEYFVIATNSNTGGYYWKFGHDGNLKLPAGGDIQDSNGNSVLNISIDGGNASSAF